MNFGEIGSSWSCAAGYDNDPNKAGITAPNCDIAPPPTFAPPTFAPPTFTPPPPPPTPCVPECVPGQLCQNGICVAE